MNPKPTATETALRTENRRLRAAADRLRVQLQVVEACDVCLACALQAKAAIAEAGNLESGETILPECARKR